MIKTRKILGLVILFWVVIYLIDNSGLQQSQFLLNIELLNTWNSLVLLLIFGGLFGLTFIIELLMQAFKHKAQK